MNLEQIKQDVDQMQVELAAATAALIKLEQERRNSVLSRGFNTVGGLSGLLSILMIVFGGGKFYMRMQVLEQKTLKMEEIGTRNASQYIATNEQWKKDHEARTDRIENSLLLLVPLLPRIETKLDALKETLEEHKRQTATR